MVERRDNDRARAQHGGTPRTGLTRRTFGCAVLGGAGLGVGLVGCSSSSTRDKRSDKTTAARSDDGFPVTVAGRPGPVTVRTRPRRVVAVGYVRDLDAALALDASLVGVVTNALFGSKLAPWQHVPDGVEKIAAPSGLPFEKVAALRPDLILATDDYAISDDYRTLSGIAPTVCPGAGLGKDKWQTTTTRIGTVLGRSAPAATVITSVMGAIERTRAAHPELAGKTFTIGPVQPDGAITTASRSTDASVPFLAQLGMRLSPKVTSLPQTSIPGRSAISTERLDLLEADVVVLTYNSDDARTRLEANPLFSRLPAVREGRYVPLSVADAISVAFPSALAIPYALDKVVPLIAAAARKA